ncbi:MAG: tetratricopeptide repeat protein [Crocosphaera sp.]|nr:tetratricopeptide repeat protein [Crocosphaera sp.]
MSLLNQSFITWINQPLLNLGNINDGPWHLYKIEQNYRNLVEGKGNLVNPVTIVHPSSFRESLIRESRLFEYQVSNPLQLADEFRTERWNVLCEYVNRYQELDLITQYQVIALLSSLCLYEAVLDYVPDISDSEIHNNNILAKLAFAKTISKLMLRRDAGGKENVEELEKIAHHAPLGSVTCFNACAELLALSAKVFGDFQATEHWSGEFCKALSHLKPSLTTFQQKRLTSVYHRAAIFIPFLQGDKEAVVQEMDLCQSLAEELMGESQNEIEQKFAHENLSTVFESRVKEALWVGDVDLAEHRAKKNVAMEPLYARYHLQLGEVLIKLGKFEEASQVYRRAARIGPPGTAIAWFMAGQCHEQLGEIEVACDCYLASVEKDQLAISAVEKLNELGQSLGNFALVNWSELYLIELQEEQKRYIQQTKTFYKPGISSALKAAGSVIS